MTETSKQNYMFLEWVLCIHYSLSFWKNTVGTKTLIDLDNKSNAIIPVYASKLGLNIHHIGNIGALKINISILKTFEIVLDSL